MEDEVLSYCLKIHGFYDTFEDYSDSGDSDSKEYFDEKHAKYEPPPIPLVTLTRSVTISNGNNDKKTIDFEKVPVNTNRIIPPEIIDFASITPVKRVANQRNDYENFPLLSCSGSSKRPKRSEKYTAEKDKGAFSRAIKNKSLKSATLGDYFLNDVTTLQNISEEPIIRRRKIRKRGKSEPRNNDEKNNYQKYPEIFPMIGKWSNNDKNTLHATESAPISVEQQSTIKQNVVITKNKPKTKKAKRKKPKIMKPTIIQRNIITQVIPKMEKMSGTIYPAKYVDQKPSSSTSLEGLNSSIGKYTKNDEDTFCVIHSLPNTVEQEFTTQEDIVETQNENFRMTENSKTEKLETERNQNMHARVSAPSKHAVDNRGNSSPCSTVSEILIKITKDTEDTKLSPVIMKPENSKAENRKRRNRKKKLRRKLRKNGVDDNISKDLEMNDNEDFMTVKPYEEFDVLEYNDETCQMLKNEENRQLYEIHEGRYLLEIQGLFLQDTNARFLYLNDEINTECQMLLESTRISFYTDLENTSSNAEREVEADEDHNLHFGTALYNFAVTISVELCLPLALQLLLPGIQ